MQDSIANVISGIMIFMDKPFEVGDWITVVDRSGEVNDITMRSTRIRTQRNTYVVIPNKTIIDAVLVNHPQKGITRVDVPVGIAYKASIPSAREVMRTSARGGEGVMTDPAPDVVVMELGDSRVNLSLRVWIERATNAEPVYSAVMEAAKLALDEAFAPLDKGASLRPRRTVRQKQLVVEPLGAIPVESQRGRLLFRADYRASRASASRTRAPRRMPPNE